LRGEGIGEVIREIGLQEKHEIDGFGKGESGSNGLHLTEVIAIMSLQCVRVAGRELHKQLIQFLSTKFSGLTFSSYFYPLRQIYNQFEKYRT